MRTSFALTLGLVTAPDGKDYPTALTAPNLPAAVAGSALGVNGLNYHPSISQVRHAPAGVTLPASVPAAGYKTGDILKAYGGTALTGAGQTVGVEAFCTLVRSDYTTFWQNDGVTRTGTYSSLVVDTGGSLQTDANDQEESALDIEWAGGMAPGANIVVYESGIYYSNNGGSTSTPGP